MVRFNCPLSTRALSPLLSVAPATAALFAALVLSQLAPLVRAEPTPPRHMHNGSLPLLATGPYPARYAVERTLTIKAPIAFGDWVWDETRAPIAGPLLITVDIATETLAVFRSGRQIGATRIIYGDDDKPTPTGVFPITQKDERHRSTIFADAPMPYMLRLTGDGISIHGAEKVRHIYATNGCVGIPNDFARRLFGVAALGDRVVISKSRQTRVGDQISTL